MTKKWWIKTAILLLVTIISVMVVMPTFTKNFDPTTSKFPFKKKINLGLDLQGGLYLVMGVDFDKLFKEIVERQLVSLNQRAKEKSITLSESKVETQGFPKDDPRMKVKVLDSDKAKFTQLIKDEFVQLRMTGEKGSDFEFGISSQARADIHDKTLNQSIEVIRNRIDEFGVSEPSISSQGNDRVVVELPGIKEVDRAKDLIGRTAKLEFRMVDDKSMQPGELEQLVAQIEKDKKLVLKEGGDLKFSDYVKAINEGAKGKIGDNAEIAFEKGLGDTRIPFLLFKHAEVTGNDLQDAQVSNNPESNRPEVSFELNPKGAIAFEKLTGNNVGHRLAIVLDGIVHSAPVINSKIGARGVITTGRGGYDDALKESKDLAIVLRAGALPAQLELMEQRVVGPSLGSDSVQKGVYASLLGILAVFLLTAFYYRVSGLIAVISLMLNVVLVIALLVTLEATLTLPGIAGVALTVGIAVDSNVVIFERIREELRSGKSISAALDTGYDKALTTILDANVSNALAAIILIAYGSGPVKGFAVTMLVGIVTTLFTAVFACRVMFDWYVKRLEEKNAKTLSI